MFHFTQKYKNGTERTKNFYLQILQRYFNLMMSKLYTPIADCKQHFSQYEDKCFLYKLCYRIVLIISAGQFIYCTLDINASFFFSSAY